MDNKTLFPPPPKREQTTGSGLPPPPPKKKTNDGTESQPSTSESGSSSGETPESIGPWFAPQFLSRTPSTTQFSQDELKPKVKFTAVGEGEPAGGQEMAVELNDKSERERYNKAFDYFSLANKQKQLFSMDEGQRQKLLADFKRANPDVPLSTAQQALNELDRTHIKKSAAAYAQELKAQKAKQIADRMGSENYFPKPGENINPEVQAEQQIKNELYQYGVDAMNPEQKNRFLAVQKFNQLKTKTTSEGDALKLLTPAEQKLIKEFKEQQLYDQWGNQIDADTLSKQEKENQKDINDLTQAYAQNYQGKAKELYEEKALALKYVDDLLNQQTPNKVAGYPVTYKKLVEVGGLSAPDMLLRSDQKQAKRLMGIRQQVWNEFEAAKRIYLLNQDPAKIGDATWSRFTDSMEQGFKGSLFEPLVGTLYNPENLSKGEYQDAYKQFAEEGLPISEKQKEEFTIEFIDKFAQTAGFSIPTMLEIGASTALMNEIGSVSGITRLAKALEAANTAKYGKGGKLLTNLMMNTAKGYVAYAPTQETGFTGVGEGSAQTFIDMLNPEKWAGGKYRKFFEFAARVGVGTTGETIQEYSGQFVNALAENGMNWEQVFAETFGRTPEDQEDQLLLTVLQSAMFSGAFNIGVLKDGLVALTQSKKPEAKQLIPVVEKVIEEREEEIKEQEAAAAGKPPEPKKPGDGDGGGGAAEIITKPKDEKGGITNGQEEETPLLGEQPGKPTKAGGATKADALPATEEDAEVVDEVLKVMEGMKVPEEKPTLEVAAEVTKPVVEAPVEEVKITETPVEKQAEIVQEEPKTESVQKEETDNAKQARFKAELLKRGLPEQGAEGSSKLLVKALTDKNTALGVLDMANKNLRELWSKETGMDLPKSQKGTRQVIEEYFKNPEEAKNITDAAKGALALYDGDVLKLANGDQNYIYENVPEATPEIAQQIIDAAREKVKQGGGEKMLKTEKPQPEKKSIADIKAEQALNQRFNYGKEGLMTRKEFMDKKLAEGATVEVKEVVATGNTAKLEQELEFLKRNAPFGNSNHPQTKRYNEVKKILDEGGIKKPEYKLREKSGGSWTITKTEYDYAQKTPSPTSQAKGLTVEEGTKVKPETPEAEVLADKPLPKKKPVKSETLSPDVVQSKVSDITTDEIRFQNREELDEERVQYLVDNFDRNKFDPITVWDDPVSKKRVVLSGHHRLEAAKRRGMKDIPTKLFNGTEQEAIDFARDSNTLGKQETPTERAKRYRDLRKRGKSMSEIQSMARQAHGADANFMVNLSMLDENSKAIQTISQFEKSSDTETKSKVRSIGDWIGQIMRKHDDLSTQQQNEMYDFLFDSYSKKAASGKITNKQQWVELADHLITKLKNRNQFTPDTVINFKNTLGKSGIELEYDEATRQAEQNVIAAQKALNDKRAELLMRGATQQQMDEILKKYEDDVRNAIADRNELRAQKDNVKKAAQAQTSIFDLVEQSNLSDNEKTEQQFQEILDEQTPTVTEDEGDAAEADEDAVIGDMLDVKGAAPKAAVTADQALQDNPALSLEGFAKIAGKPKEDVRAEWEEAFDKKMKDDKWVKRYNDTATSPLGRKASGENAVVEAAASPAKVSFTFLGQKLTGTLEGESVKGDDGKTYKVGDKMGQANDVKPVKKTLEQKVLDALDSMKMDTSGGKTYALPFPPQLWNGFIDAVKFAAQGGMKIADAIQKGVEWLKQRGISDQEAQQYAQEFQTQYNAAKIQAQQRTQQQQQAQQQLAQDAKAFEQEFDTQLQNKFKKGVKDFVNKVEEKLFDSKAIAKRMLEAVGAAEVIWRKNLSYGASGAAVDYVKEKRKEIFGRLKKGEKVLLNHIIQYTRTIELDNYREALAMEMKALQDELVAGVTAQRQQEIEQRIEQIKDRAGVRVKHTELTVNGKKIALSKELAQARLEQLEKEQPELYQKLKDRADKYFATNRELLKMRHDEGLLTDDQYERLRYFDYSQRLFVQHILDFESLRGSDYYTSSELKKLEDGSTELLMNNAQYLLDQNAMSTYRSIFNNNADRALYNFAEKNPNNGLIEVQQPTGFDADGKKIFPAAPTGKSEIKLKDKSGNDQSILVPNEFYASWKRKDPLIAAQLANAMAWGLGVKPLKLFATGVNPFFALWNLPRDLGHSFFFTDAYSQFAPLAGVQMAKHYTGALKNWKQDFKEYRDEGGMMDFLTTQGHVKIHPDITDDIGSAIETAQEIAGWINSKSEIITRLAVRRRYIEKYSQDFFNDNGRMPGAQEMPEIKERATEKARAMMDFSQGGEWTKAADNFLPYINAAFQALRVAGRSFKENPGATGVKIAQGVGIVVGLTLYNLGYDDEDEKNGVIGYKAISPNVKSRGIVIMMPYTKTNQEGQKVRPYMIIPIPQEFSIFKTMGEEVTSWIKTGEFTGEPIAESLSVTLPSGNPANVPVIDAITTYATNYDRFRDEKIVYDADKLEDWAEYNTTTPQMYKDFGKVSGLSPERTKAAIGKVVTNHESNIYSIMLSNSYDLVSNQFENEEDKKDFQEMISSTVENSLQPLQRRFYREPNSREQEKTISEKASLEENTRKKIEEKDVTKEYVHKYHSSEDKASVKKEFEVVAKEAESKSAGATERMNAAFKKGIKVSQAGTDVVVDIMYQDANPEIRARAFSEVYNSSNTARKELLARDVILLDIDSERFLKEFERISNDNLYESLTLDEIKKMRDNDEISAKKYYQIKEHLASDKPQKKSKYFP